MEFQRAFASQTETSNFRFSPDRDEVSNNYKLIKGKIAMAGREPDGDSVGFIPDNVDHFKDVYRGYALKPNKSNGSIQLRFEGIDTPELHYGTALQPCSVEARDYLLQALLKFNVAYQPVSDGKIPSKVLATKPEFKEIFIATNMLETHGRPVSYLFALEDAVGFTDGDTNSLDQGALQKSINYKMLQGGWAYLLAYTSMPLAHFTLFKSAANEARSNAAGVWKQDATADFKLSGLDSINGLSAQLIYPKLFRRCIDFLKSGQKDLKEWLRINGDENDGVRISEGTTVQILEPDSASK